MIVSFSDANVKNGTVIDILPAGYRPNAWGTPSVRNGFDNQNGEFVISSDGKVKYVSNNGSCDYGHALIVFPMGS